MMVIKRALFSKKHMNRTFAKSKTELPPAKAGGLAQPVAED